jgi:hypothetical protein
MTNEVTYSGHEADHSIVSAETAHAFAEQMRARGLDPTETLARYGYGAKPGQSQDAPPPKDHPPKSDESIPREARHVVADIGPDGLPRLTAEQKAALAGC